MSNKAKGVLAQYNLFLNDFDFVNKKEQLASWTNVLNCPRQKEVIVVPQEGESAQHFRGKRNMVDLFVEYNESHAYRFLIWTEVEQKVPKFINAFGGPRTYQPDIVVFDRIGFSKNHPHFGIYVIEIDGRKNHTNKNEVWKGMLRDEFFFETYHAVTIRIPTWRAHGRQRTFNEFQDLHEEMIYKCNQFLVAQEEKHKS